MYAVTIFGALLFVLSVLMIAKPDAWADGIVKFSEKKWFHPFEIISRFVFGLLFVLFADQAAYPLLIKIIGFLLIAVSIGLVFTPPSKHRQFARWSAQKFRNKFRPLGFLSLLFGVFLVYLALPR